jgi:hypothetical protein
MNPMRNINKSQNGCNNKVWSGRPKEKKQVLNCGSTGWYGDVVACSDCEAQWNKKYPNGLPYSAEDDYDDGIM